MQASLAIVGGILGLVAYFSALDWRWLLGAVVLPANWPYTIFIIMPANRRLMDTAPEAATAETRRMLERLGHSRCRAKCSGSPGSPDLAVGSAARLLAPAFPQAHSSRSLRRQRPKLPDLAEPGPASRERSSG
jgi:hypothetical protein